LKLSVTSNCDGAITRKMSKELKVASFLSVLEVKKRRYFIKVTFPPLPTYI
jgi:hypothetical protein